MKSWKLLKNINSQRGATLLIIVVVIVIFAIIGAAIYTMTATSFLNQAVAQMAAKTFYLAESGVRVAASEYKNAITSGKLSTLTSLHDKTFLSPGGNGQFNIKVYPYWLYAANDIGSGATNIILYLPGGVPILNKDDESIKISIPASALLKVKNNNSVAVISSSVPVISGSYDSTYGTAVTFTLTTPFPMAISAGSEIFLGCVYSNINNVQITNGGSLTLTDTANNAKVKIFPPEGGTFSVFQDGSVYSFTYKSRNPSVMTGSETSVTLQNIEAIGTITLPLTLKYDSGHLYDDSFTSQIFLGKSLGIKSNATFGN